MDSTRDILAYTEKEIFEEARDRLRMAAEAESINRQNARFDLLFREGEGQWDDKPITTGSKETPEVVINLTDAMCVRVVNNIKQQRPRGKCHPVGDGADIDRAKVINGIGRHIENRSKASIAYDNAADLAVTSGEGYWRLLTEYLPKSFDQEIRIAPIFDSATVYLDPESEMPDGSDAMWGLITVKMVRDEYRRTYPLADNASFSGPDGDYAQDWEDKEKIRLAEYFRIVTEMDTLYQCADQMGRTKVYWKAEMPTPEVLAAAGLTITRERKELRKRVEWFQLNGTKVILRRDMPGTHIPIIRVTGHARKIEGKVYRRGMVRSMIDAQKMVNYGECSKIKRLGLAPQSPWIGAEGQFDGHPEWDDDNVTAHTKLEYKPVTVMTEQGEVVLPPPSRIPPAGIEAGFAEFVQGMRNNLMAVAGMPNEPGVDKQGEVISGRAIEKRQYLSDQSHFGYYDNVTWSIAYTWEIILEWIPEVYSEARMLRIIGEDGTPSMVGINQATKDGGVDSVKNDLSVGTYSVVMDTGPGYETKRQEGSETLLEMLKSPVLAQLIAQHGPDLIFRSMDHPYMQELADRLAGTTPDGFKQVLEQLPESARAIVQQLYGQVQKLTQALQAAQQEIKQGIQKEQIKAQTKMHDTEVSNETKRLDTAIKSHTALAVEEIKASASLLNTHTEAKYHKEEAERMIEQGQKAEGGGNE